MAISREDSTTIRDIESSGDSPKLEAYIESLQDVPSGEGFQTKDYYFLALTGILIPALLLAWGGF